MCKRHVFIYLSPLLWLQSKIEKMSFLTKFEVSKRLLMSCVCNAFAFVYCCLMVTCWERADLLALVCDV